MVCTDTLASAGCTATNTLLRYTLAFITSPCRAVSFHSMTLEEALRHLLTNSGFRLPGEGQKVSLMLK
jgi:Sec7 domain